MPNICSKSQYAKNKWEGAEDPTISNFFKIESRKLLLVKSTNLTMV